MKVRRVRVGQWKVLALCNERGDCDLLDFLAGLGQRHVKDRTRLLALLDRVAEHGPPNNAAVSHHLSGEVWEFIQGGLRVLWFYDAGKVVVCSNGLLKKTQKIPPGDIRLAETRCAAYRVSKKAQAVEILNDDEEGEEL